VRDARCSCVGGVSVAPSEREVVGGSWARQASATCRKNSWRGMSACVPAMTFVSEMRGRGGEKGTY